MPPLSGASIVRDDGTPGLDVVFYAGPDFGGDVVHRGQLASSRVLLLGAAHENVPADDFSLTATGTFTPTETGTHTFTLIQTGDARLLVDGEVVIDGVANPPGPGSDFFGLGSEEVQQDVELLAGQPVNVTIHYSSRGSAVVHGVKIGCRVPSPPDLIDRAVAAAAAADLAIVVVGTNDDWESEGHDRMSLDLPGDQDELVTQGARGQPPHGGGVELRRPGHPRLGRPGAGAAADVVRRPRNGQRDGGRPVGRGRAGRAATDHLSPSSRGQPVVRQLPR